MCAVTGWISFDRELSGKEGIIKEMADSMAHRGPDAAGQWCGEDCLLAHRRLSVMDPANGAQPMIRGDLVLVYNGELYNTAELRAQLEKYGHHFETRCDTEVLLAAYTAWGESCLDRLNGIFAFAVWDRRRKRLFCARDRAGVKPFFYYRSGKSFVFASEIKALFRNPMIRPALDEQGAVSLMLLGPARKGGLGVFSGIYELRPGECAVFSEQGFKKQFYWRVKAQAHSETPEETAEHLGFLIKDSIERQLVSDVPLCTFLSGGLDSSLISAVAAEKARSQGKTLSTFSIDYKDNRKNFVPSEFQPDEDAPWVARMKDHIASDHTDVVIDSPQLADALIPSMKARDLPGMADVDSSLYIFCGEIKKRFTVALSGECADEIFGGYPWYQDPALLFADGFPWSRSTSQRAGLLRSELCDRLTPFEFVAFAASNTVRDTSYLDTDTKEEKARRRMFVLNYYWFMQTLLDRKDRCSMAHGLEVRVPFCDHRIAQYVYNIPWEIKNFSGREKGLVRLIAEKYLPHDVVWRKKSPYPKTHNPSYFSIVFSRFKDLMKEKEPRLTLILDRKKLNELIESEGRSFSANWYGQLMTIPQMFAYLIQLEIWFRTYEPEILF